MLFECMGVCVLSPAHESELRGYLVYVLIVNTYQFCLNSATVYYIGQPCEFYFILFFLFFLGGGGGGRETFLEVSVDNIIYRDYIVNRSSFLYRRLDRGRRFLKGRHSAFLRYSSFCHLFPFVCLRAVTYIEY